MFQRSRYIFRVNLDHVVVTLFLLLQNFKSFLCISGSDHAIGYFSLDQKCCIFVAHIREGNEITEGGHSVSTSGTGIGAGKRGKLFPVHVVYPVDLRQGLCQRKSDCCSCWRNMLEGSCCRKSGCFFQIAHQLPAVKCIQEVDVSRSSGKNFDGKLASILHVNSGRFLVGIAAIF